MRERVHFDVGKEFQMPHPDPTITQAVVQGGVLMGPYLLLVLIWIGTTASFFIRKSRSVKHLLSLLIFPIGFGLFAIGQWALQWHFFYQEMIISGYPSETRYIDNALRIGRSTLVIVSTSGLSLVGVILALFLPLEYRTQEASFQE